MAKVVVYDETGKPHSVEAVDAKEMVRSGSYKAHSPDGKTVTLADVETLPGEPQYPPTPQPEHPMPTEHQVTQDGVRLRQEAHARGEVPAREGYDKDGKLLPGTKLGPDGKPIPTPPLAGPVANPLKAPQFAGTVQPAPPVRPAGTPAAGVPPTK